MVNPLPPNINKPEPEKEKKIKKPDIKIYLLCGLLAVVSFFALKMYFNSVKKWQNKNPFSTRPFAFVKKGNRFGFSNKIMPSFLFQKRSSAKQPDPKKLKSQNLILNGIFISSEKKLALINNIIVKEGDLIGDVMVLQINSDYVELGNRSQRFQLKPYKQ